MTRDQQELIARMIKEGEKRFRSPREPVDFATGNSNSEELLNDIGKHPHVFVLACIMDRQIRAEKAWLIPYQVGKEMGGFNFRQYLKLSRADVRRIFARNNLHRFNAKMADCFYSAVRDIHTKYRDDASLIWSDNPRSAAVIRRFLEFNGVGPKIATMATRILAMYFKVPMEEYSSIDISADIQVRKFFAYHKLIRANAKIDEIIYLAREIYPKCPGILDFAAWREGREL